MAFATKRFDYLFRIIIIGESFVGKTNLLLRFADEQFDSAFITTIGIDFKVKTMELYGKKIKLHLVDSAGQERFKTLTRQYYRSANGCLLVYDVSDRSSFEHITHWMEELKNYSTNPVIPIIVGNKIDLIKRVHTNELKELATKFKCKYFETSALNNIGVDLVFEELVSDMAVQVNLFPPSKVTTQAPTIDIAAISDTSSTKCCN
jgi:small GTP-binding protein